MTTLYAWLATQPDGEERLCAVIDPINKIALPAVTAVERIALLMEPLIRAQGLIEGLPVRLAKFREVD